MEHKTYGVTTLVSKVVELTKNNVEILRARNFGDRYVLVTEDLEESSPAIDTPIVEETDSVESTPSLKTFLSGCTKQEIVDYVLDNRGVELKKSDYDKEGLVDKAYEILNGESGDGSA